MPTLATLSTICQFFKLAVVLQLHCTRLVQSVSLNPELCHLRLFPAYRNSLSEDAVLAGGVQDEASPPASDVQELLTRLQPQLLADQFELLFLCIIQRVVPIPKVRAGTCEGIA
jgi:hypothetical protein